MRKNTLALALLVSTTCGWAATAEARPANSTRHATSTVRYTGYYYGATDPQQLANLVERALRRDPTGRTMLDPAKCIRDGSCAAPLNYVESFNAHDPEGGWTLENLVAKLRQLRLDCHVEGIYQMDRIALAARSSFGRSDINGMSRSFRPNECAWVNPETGRPVLAQHCTNPVGIRIDLDCVYHDIEVRDASEYALIWARYDRETDRCFAYRWVDQLYQADSSRAVWLNMPRGCIGRPCDLSADNAILGREQMTQGQIPVRRGRLQVRVDRNAFLVYCLKRRTQFGVASSFAVGVRWQMDYRFVNRAWHARVYYNTNDMLADGRRLNGPDGIALYASTREMEEAMRNGDGR